MFAELENGKDDDWSKKERIAFIEMNNLLRAKSEEAISPISGARYSAIMVFKDGDNYSVHAGANVDPEKAEQLKLPEYRNCAERQAALSAQINDGLENEDLRLVFLYRKQDLGVHLAAEKLIPCKDCHSKYLLDLIANNGKLVLIIDDNLDREFLVPEHDSDVTEKIHTVETREGDIFYKILNAKAMRFLKVETKLGARVNGT